MAESARKLLLPALLIAMASVVEAQGLDPTVRLGAGAAWVDLTCSGCAIDSQRGVTGLVAIMLPIRGPISAGIEGSLWHQHEGTVQGHVGTVAAVAAMQAVGGLRPWLSLGIGYLWQSLGDGRDGGLAGSARVGLDIGLNSHIFFGPHVGYVASFAKVGPRVTTDDIIGPDSPKLATRLSHLGVGAVLTIR
jgi:hypothetical protein